jgi:hypothetical protein
VPSKFSSVQFTISFLAIPAAHCLQLLCSDGIVSPAESKQMTYQVFWIVENHILYIGLSGDLTLGDFRDSSKHIADHMDAAYSTSSDIVIGIIDLREASLGQLVRSVISAAQSISEVIDPRIWKAKSGFTILITTSESAKVLTSIIIRLTAQPMTTVGTLLEALTVVSYMYPELQSQLDAYRDGPSSIDGASQVL